VSSICDDRGDEPTYNNLPISEIISKGMGIGDVLGLLWFKRVLPRYATKFFETCLVMVADHGPCVSGAHNTIVASRAGKDIFFYLSFFLFPLLPSFLSFKFELTQNKYHIQCGFWSAHNRPPLRRSH
jgi:ATP citrate (pro-S)-lyase